MDAAIHLHEQNQNHIEPEKALLLWRCVLVRLIIDYFEGFPGARNQLLGTSFAYLCEIVGFDTERTRQAVLLAEKEYLASGMVLKAWLKHRYQTIIEPKARERHRYRTTHPAIHSHLGTNRLREVCPGLAENLGADRLDWYGWTERRRQAHKNKDTVEHRRVKEFFEVFWGRSGGCWSGGSRGGSIGNPLPYQSGVESVEVDGIWRGDARP